ncbi:ty3-gypsy retrotransposon protein [Cucumis melo var. makuwa]|uniref:Ty3-gypsy retrotransposon protein n=1 Tax=Cucumis melo var. makuwa TaxID=1194695 RepID=A0A5A7TZA6_CUCMM|nr:ty3-gypsy retrotransposon protein [Cucumis melo var. makuwa]
MQQESGVTRRERHRPRFYYVKVGNVIRVIGEKGIALSAKSEAFGRILPEEVYTPKRLRSLRLKWKSFAKREKKSYSYSLGVRGAISREQFDGKGNFKQHIVCFVETCDNVGLRGDQLVRQFVRSLKENAFEWYADLELEVINDWEQLKKEFFNRFYSTRRVVSMMESTNTKQLKREPVIDYINRQRALFLDCKDKITELSTSWRCAPKACTTNFSIFCRE